MTTPRPDVHALGARIPVRWPEDDAVRAAWEDAWSWCIAASPESLIDAPPVDARDSAGGHIHASTFTQKVTHSVITAGQGRLLMFHAAAIANPATGQAIVCIAPGGTGKTTFVRTLGPGRAYITDETVGVTRDGTILPYPKPLSVRNADKGHKDEVPPHTLGLLAPEITVRPHTFVSLRRDDQHVGPPVIQRIGTIDALVDVAQETSSISQLEAPLHWIAKLFESTGGLARITYRDAETLRDFVDATIGEPT